MSDVDVTYIENRVTVAEFGSLPADSQLLLPIATSPGIAQQRCHHVVVRAFGALAKGASAKGYRLLVASGHRVRRWPNRAAYEEHLIKRYGSVQEGRKWLAYASPHETGLVFDLGCHGLKPDSKSAAAQQETPLHGWLKREAYLYGFHPYKPEPWHWEMRIPLYDFGSAPSSQMLCTEDDPDCCEGIDQA